MERIVARYNPDITAFLGNYIIGFLLLISPVLYPAVWDSPLGDLLQVGLPVLMGLGFVMVAGAEFMRRTTHYYIGEEGLMREFKFIAVKRTFVSYDDIEQLSVTQSVLQRIFGVGDIEVNTAGSHGVELSFHQIRDPHGAERYIRHRIEASSMLEVSGNLRPAPPLDTQ